MGLSRQPDGYGALPQGVSGVITSVIPRTFKLDDVLNDSTTMLKIGKTNAIEVNWIKIKR